LVTSSTGPRDFDIFYRTVHLGILPRPVSDFRFELQPIASCSPALLAEVTSLVNRANMDRRGVFQGDRLRPDTLVEYYGGREILLLWDTSRPIGVLLLEGREGGLWVFLLAVAPENQGTGLGQLMLEEALRIGRERGFALLVLEAVDSGRLLNFYARFGFEVVARQRCEVGHWNATEPFDLVTMNRRL
jgi:GNAT superfamily N-acetyltransferase